MYSLLSDIFKKRQCSIIYQFADCANINLRDVLIAHILNYLILFILYRTLLSRLLTIRLKIHSATLHKNSSNVNDLARIYVIHTKYFLILFVNIDRFSEFKNDPMNL